MNRRRFVAAGAGSLVVGGLGRPVFATQPAPDDDRLAWWRDARFGMFVHVGLYSIPGGECGKLAGSHEWIRNNARIPHEEYIRLAGQFNPVALDADAIVRMARDAGQKYVVVTTKHHEGFSLFDSAVSTYDAIATPYRRDIMRAFAEACRRHDMKLGWYYSIMDWYHPDYLPRRDWELRDASGADHARYVRFMHAQLTELLTHYGDVAVMWFDGQWENTWNHALGQATYDLCRRLQPRVIVNNRVDVKPPQGNDRVQGGGMAGDYSTPELEIPARGLPGQDWESCMTMNDNWGYAKDDNNWKSPGTLIGLLVEAASKGGNLLLNIGPMGDGRVPQPSVDSLAAIGRWMRVNGDAIYASRASMVDTPACRTTTQGRVVNVFIERWVPGDLLLPGLQGAPRRAWLMADRGTTLPVQATPEGAVLTLPARPPDATCSVVRVEFAGLPRSGLLVPASRALP